MQTISPSDLLRQKRLQLTTSNVHEQESTTGFTHRLAVTLPFKLSAIHSPKFTQTASQKMFTTGVTKGPTIHKKF